MVVGEYIFDRNITSALPLTHENLEYCFTKDDETKLMNGYKGVLNKIRFFPTEKNEFFFRSKEGRNIV